MSVQVKEASSLQIVVNGEVQEILSGSTVFQLLENRIMTHKAVIVELNGKILTQEHWQSTSLRSDDKLEILIFLGGG